MPLVRPHLSDALRLQLTQANDFHKFTKTSYPSTITVSSDRLKLLAAYTHLIDDLYGSILHLLSSGGPYDGGALALLRPLVEVYLRACWLFFCASDEVVRRAHSGEEVTPGLGPMIDSLDQMIGSSAHANLRSSLRTLHGFTHCGEEQLGRRSDASGNLRSTYSDAEKEQVIRSSTYLYMKLSVIFCCESSNRDRENDSALLIERKYLEIYG